MGFDGDDEHAQRRRAEARVAHLELGDTLHMEGKLLDGAALLDDRGNMVGSVLFCRFDTRADLDAWLKVEPYVTGDVWKKVEVHPCRIGPSFEALHTRTRKS